MEVKNLSDGNYRYHMTFEGEEVEAVGAAYREHIYELASRGNTGSISEHDVWVANTWNSDDEPQKIRTSRPETGIIEVLEHFADRTDEAIAAMPELTGYAPYLSVDIPLRCQLGNIARRLVEEIREKTTIADFSTALEDGPESIIDGH